MAKPLADEAASQILTVKLPPSAHAQIVRAAERNFQTRTGFLRAAVEDTVAAALEHEPESDALPGGHASARPPPERASICVPLYVTPSTYAALREVAAQAQVPVTAIIRQAAEAAVAEAGGPAVIFPATCADGRPYPRRRHGVPGIAQREFLGMVRPRSFVRKITTDAE